MRVGSGDDDELRAELIEAFVAVRAHTERLAAHLSPEDQQLQAMADASPTKWHRGHTTWFWETFLLAPSGVGPHEPAWGELFNSYYEAVGPRHPRPERGLLSRPSADEVGRWRAAVDARVVALLSGLPGPALRAAAPTVSLGVAHEQQHQELLLTDILAAFARNPLRPTVLPGSTALNPRPARSPAATWVERPGGVTWMGHEGDGFAFDNEGPRHQVLLQPFALCTRLVSVAEWIAFADDGGYRTPSLWLSEGLNWVREHGIDAPGYARRDGAALEVFGVHGPRIAHPDEPVLHLSLYEADALATWLGARLPTEAEWEACASTAGDDPRWDGLFGAAWQWTRSSYAAYPGFRVPEGAVGEYNGKFMVNQYVLRGSSVYTPAGHSRPTYRNFWPAPTRFQAAGVRVARDV